MIKVYSESLMDLQDYLKGVEIHGNRGMVYSVVTEVLINVSLLALEAGHGGRPVQKGAYDTIMLNLTDRYRCLSDVAIREEVRRIVLLLLDNRKDLIIKLGNEIVQTGLHGDDLVYNIVDLVACRYWFTEKTNHLASNL
ncbi:hypothetical protein MLDJOKPK_00229 [Salmonella phage SPAsTU]|nr:hypothetical protein STsAS_181 [Salmonella phage STsAS]AWN09136.1 hypothetical protein MLDJOKPK_00229 [Salmonella phage SPAsTU]